MIYLRLQFQSPQHSYNVKIINPHRKSDVIVRYLHNFTSRFESAVALCMELVEEFKDVVPDSLSLVSVTLKGRTILTSGWLQRKMYGKYPKGEITLSCGGQTE